MSLTTYLQIIIFFKMLFIFLKYNDNAKLVHIENVFIPENALANVICKIFNILCRLNAVVKKNNKIFPLINSKCIDNFIGPRWKCTCKCCVQNIKCFEINFEFTF